MTRHRLDPERLTVTGVHVDPRFRHITWTTNGEDGAQGAFVDLGPVLRTSWGDAAEFSPEMAHALGIALLAWALYKEPPDEADEAALPFEDVTA